MEDEVLTVILVIVENYTYKNSKKLYDNEIS
jgi:hypothetical protein